MHNHHKLGRLLGFALCLFLSLPVYGARDNKEVLDAVLQSARPGTVVVFDLDDTLFSVAPRKFGLMKAFASDPEIMLKFPLQSDIVREKLKLRHVGYAGPGVDLWALGINGKTAGDKEFIEECKNYIFGPRFEGGKRLPSRFENGYHHLDVPNPGAVAYVQALRKKGATIVYLTGRSEAARQGTLDALRNSGFPEGKLFLKGKKNDGSAYKTDHEFKVDRIPDLKKLGNVIGFFDNEPENVLAMRRSETLPESTNVVFVSTAWRGTKMDELVENEPRIFWVSDFNRLTSPEPASTRHKEPAPEAPTHTAK